MVTTPQVTIGMPVFNGERYLDAALDSLLGQLDVDLELIIADNGSTDGTSRIGQDYAATDSRVRYIGSDRNRGIAWNFNRLVDLARAPYFKWADSDDLCSPTLVRRCIDALDEDAAAVLAYSWARYVDHHGETLRDVVEVPRYGLLDSPAARARGFLSLPTSHALELQGVIRTKDLVVTSRMGPYAASDLTLILELAMRGRFVEIREPLFIHRMHAARASLAAPTPRGLSRMHSEDGSAVWFPRWHLGAHFVRGVLTSPSSLPQRLRALPWVGAWGVRHWKQLTYDLAAVAPGPAAAAAERSRRAMHARRATTRGRTTQSTVIE